MMAAERAEICKAILLGKRNVIPGGMSSVRFNQCSVLNVQGLKERVVRGCSFFMFSFDFFWLRYPMGKQFSFLFEKESIIC